MAYFMIATETENSTRFSQRPLMTASSLKLSIVAATSDLAPRTRRCALPCKSDFRPIRRFQSIDANQEEKTRRSAQPTFARLAVNCLAPLAMRCSETSGRAREVLLTHAIIFGFVDRDRVRFPQIVKSNPVG